MTPDTMTSARARRLRGTSAHLARVGASRRGSMLLVGLLVLLALTSVGLTAVKISSDSLSVVSNQRRGAVAFRVTEGGAYASMAVAEQMGPSAFAATANVGLTYDTNGEAQETAARTWWPEDMTSEGVEYFDLTAQGSFGYEGYLQTQAGFQGGEVPPPPATFRVEITDTGLRQPMLGFGFTGAGGQCRFKYQFDTKGNIGAALNDSAVNDTLDVWQQIRTMVFVGPLPCDAAPAGAGVSS